MRRQARRSTRRPAIGGRAVGVLLLHALVIWAACAGTIGIGRTAASMEATLIVHAAIAPAFAAGVSAVYFHRPDHASPLLTASVVLALIVLMDVLLVALILDRSLDMFRSVLGTWLPLALIFAATAATGWTLEAARQRRSRSVS